MICIEWIGMVRPRGLVRAAPPQLSFRPAGGHYWTSIGGGSLLDADQQKILLPIWDLHAVSPVEGFPGALQRRLNQILMNLLAMV